MSLYPQVYDPMIQEYYRHYRDSSPVNDHQSDLDIRDYTSVFTQRNFLIEP
jgi:hypothetical protein